MGSRREEEEISPVTAPPAISPQVGWHMTAQIGKLPDGSMEIVNKTVGGWVIDYLGILQQTPLESTPGGHLTFDIKGRIREPASVASNFEALLAIAGLDTYGKPMTGAMQIKERFVAGTVALYDPVNLDDPLALHTIFICNKITKWAYHLDFYPMPQGEVNFGVKLYLAPQAGLPWDWSMW